MPQNASAHRLYALRVSNSLNRGLWRMAFIRTNFAYRRHGEQGIADTIVSGGAATKSKSNASRNLPFRFPEGLSAKDF